MQKRGNVSRMLSAPVVGRFVMGLLVAVATAGCGSSSSSDSNDGGGLPASGDGAAGDATSMQEASASGDGAAAQHDGGGLGAPSDAGADGGDGGDDASTGVGEAGTTYTMEVTFYGWADNSPPGNAISYPKNGGFPTVHDAAGGTGTFADPITFATDKSELAPGTRVYVPFIEKYLVMEDDCAQCDSDWSGSMKRHIDVWMNSNGTESSNALIMCEDQWTQSAAMVEVNPPAGRTVTTDPLFDPSTNVCRTSP
jgi:hypothetical protein